MTSRSTEAMTTWLGTLARVGIVDTQTMLAGQALMAYVVGEEKLDALRSWFALCTPETAALEKQAAIEMCVWMAHADREIVANELEILAELVRQSGLSQAAQAAILGAISHPPSLMGLERRITHPVLRELMLALTWELAIYVALFAIAFGLRFWDLGARALHHDESIHAQWSWGLIQGNYRHDPVFHGPLYYHAQGLVFLVFGASDYTARVSPAIFGMALVALPLLMRRWLGPVGTIAAVAFLTFSPTVLYYSRFIREDVYMAFFILAMAAAMWRYMAGDQTPGSSSPVSVRGGNTPRCR